MMRRQEIYASLCVAAVAWLPATAMGGTPPGSAFNYQGQLRQDGVPMNGTVDLSFTLFAITGSQAADALIIDGVEVINGLFAVELDFGPDAFDPAQVLLELACAPPATRWT